jgi:hypothetical protein
MHFYWILLKSDVFGDCQPCVLAGTSENYGSAWYPLDGHYWITSAWLYSLLKYLPSFWMLLVACNSYVMHLSVLHMEAATQTSKHQQVNNVWKWLLSCPTQYVTVYATVHQSPLLYNYERTYQKVPVMIVKMAAQFPYTVCYCICNSSPVTTTLQLWTDISESSSYDREGSQHRAHPYTNKRCGYWIPKKCTDVRKNRAEPQEIYLSLYYKKCCMGKA